MRSTFLITDHCKPVLNLKKYTKHYGSNCRCITTLFIHIRGGGGRIPCTSSVFSPVGSCWSLRWIIRKFKSLHNIVLFFYFQMSIAIANMVIFSLGWIFGSSLCFLKTTICFERQLRSGFLLITTYQDFIFRRDRLRTVLFFFSYNNYTRTFNLKK